MSFNEADKAFQANLNRCGNDPEKCNLYQGLLHLTEGLQRLQVGSVSVIGRPAVSWSIPRVNQGFVEKLHLPPPDLAA